MRNFSIHQVPSKELHVGKAKTMKELTLVIAQKKTNNHLN